MKRIAFGALMLAISSAGAMLPSVPAAAQQIPPAVVATLDVQRVLFECAASKSIRPQLDQYRVATQTEINKNEEALRNEEQELLRQRTILAPDAFEQKRKDFEKKVSDAQRGMQEKNRTFDIMTANARNDILKAMQDIVKGIVTQRGISVVLDRAVVAFAIDSIDITEQVLKQVDQKLPTLKLSSVPPGPQGAATPAPAPAPALAPAKR